MPGKFVGFVHRQMTLCNGRVRYNEKEMRN